MNRPTPTEIDRAVRKAARLPLDDNDKQARVLYTALEACLLLELSPEPITTYVMQQLARRQPVTARGAVAAAVEACCSSTPAADDVGRALLIAQDLVRVVDAGSDGWMTTARGEHGQVRFAVVRPTLQQAEAIAACHRAITAAGILQLCPICSERGIREQANGNSRQRLQAAIDSGCSCSPEARQARERLAAEAKPMLSQRTFAASTLELQNASGCVISTFAVDGDNAEQHVFRALRQALPDDCDAAKAIDDVLPHAARTSTSAALRALVYTASTCCWLAEHDPQALKQALLALAAEGHNDERGWQEALKYLRDWQLMQALDVAKATNS